MKKLLEIRRKMRNRRPKFIRQTYGIYKRIDDKWRKPKGRHAKQKHQMGGHRSKVKPGFRTNKIVRDFDRTGFMPVVIHSISHIKLLNKNIHGAVIGSGVGNRKKLVLIAELKKHGIKILNLKEGYEKKIQEELSRRKQEKEERVAGKSKKKEKKVAAKEEKKELTEEEKQALEKKEKDKILTKENK